MSTDNNNIVSDNNNVAASSTTPKKRAAKKHVVVRGTSKYALAQAIQKESGKLQTPVARLHKYVRAVLVKRGSVAGPKKVRASDGTITLKEQRIGVAPDATLLIAAAGEEDLIKKMRAAERLAEALAPPRAVGGDAQTRVTKRHVVAALAAQKNVPVY